MPKRNQPTIKQQCQFVKRARNSKDGFNPARRCQEEATHTARWHELFVKLCEKHYHYLDYIR